MKISIITLSYNSELSIERTFRSVARCKNSDMEYIVVDGKSTDRTLEIIKKYHSIIDNYVSEKDNGLYDALNKGIRMATGEWIILLAADDEMLPMGIKGFVDSVQQDTDVWCGTIISENKYGYFYEKSEKDLSKLKTYCSLRNPASFFKKIMFDKYGYYDSKYKCNGDRELFLKWYLKGAKFQIEDIPVEVFHWGGISTNDLTKYAIPESKEISIKYGMSQQEADEHYEKDIAAKSKKNSFKESALGNLVYQLCYSDIMFPIMKKIMKLNIVKLTKGELKEYKLL